MSRQKSLVYVAELLKQNNASQAEAALLIILKIPDHLGD